MCVGVDEWFFEVGHVDVCVRWCHFGTHSCALGLFVMFVHEVKIVTFENECEDKFDDFIVWCEGGCEVSVFIDGCENCCDALIVWYIRVKGGDVCCD